jgi:hypothetical protein
MPNAVYALLLLLVVYVLGVAFFKSELFGYACAAALLFAFMVVLHHYMALQMFGYAIQTTNPYLRYFLFRSAVTVGAVAPLLLLVVVWFSRERLKPWLVYGLWTGYDEVARLAPYYPHFSLITLLGSADLFAVVGMMVPVALSIVALRKAHSPRTLSQPVRRAASALHGESNWLPIAAAREWFKRGGITSLAKPAVPI